MDSDIQQGPSTTPATAAVAPQIRSRITVVCAECKRLKLKCDRRNPCGSCQKRDTVSRCIYSPAAAEKVDLHSLNNRLIQVEATLAQLTSGQFTPSYPFSAPSSSNGPPPPSSSLNNILSPPTIQHSSLAIPLEEIGGTWLNEIDLGFNLPAGFIAPPKEGTFSNVKVEPHSLDIPNSLSGEFGDFDMTDRPSTSSSSSSSVNQTTIASPNLASLSISSSNGHIQLPPTSEYYPSSPSFPSTSNRPQLTPTLITLLPSLNTYTSSRQSSQRTTLLSYLDLAEESSAYTYPFLNWKTLRERALELLMNARPNASSPAANARDKEMAREKEREKERDKKEREAQQARQLFMGSAASRTRPIFGTSASSIGDVTMEDMNPQSSRSPYLGTSEDQSGRPSTARIVEGVPFFAVLCVAIALGAHEAERRTPKAPGGDDNKKGAGRPRSKSNSSPESVYWYSLSVQAIGIWEAAIAITPVSNETSSTQVESQDGDHQKRQTTEDRQHEMDYISACLLQLAFLSKEGLNVSGAVVDNSKTSEKTKDNLRKRSPGLAKDSSKMQSAKGVAAFMFPLVGKIVNYARQMSLNRDPEDMGIPVQAFESGLSTSPSTASSSANGPNGLPSVAKKARSNSKLSDPSVLANLSASRAARESRFSLYEVEIRRRVWWTIMYYDLFVSDIMNQPPLIADNSFNTKRPVANVDEKAFGPTSIRIPPPADGGEDGTGYSKDSMRYFEIRSRLTLLVRNIKRRMNTPEFGHAQQVRTSYYGTSPHSHCYSIDQAASMEAEVRAWLNDLPWYYQVDGDTLQDRGENASEPTLIAQRCEVAMTAHRLVLRVYLPFLKKHAAGVPHQASLGSINAAHGILKAAKVLSELWKLQGGRLVPSSLSPALLDFYPFPRCVFDAAVVCAHAVIKQPSTMWAAAAMEDVDVALDIMKETSVSKFGSAVGAAYVVNFSDSIRIVEALKLIAEGGEGLRIGDSPNVPCKRKYHEVDELHNSPPPVPAYVYPTVPTAIISPSAQELAPTSVISHSAPPPPSSVGKPLKRQLPFPVVTGGDRARNESGVTTSPKGNDKDKKAKKPYPVVGVRKRPLKDGSSFAQSSVAQSPTTISNTSTPAPGSRRQSVSTPIIEKPATSSTRTMYQNTHQQSPVTSHPPPFQSPNIPQLQAVAAQEQFAYRSRSSSLSQDPRLQVQRPRRDSTLSTSTDYPMGAHNAPEDQRVDMSVSSASPQDATTPEMHIGSSMSSRQHALPQPYAESPTSYDPPTAQFEFPFNHQSAAVEAFNTTGNNSFDTRPDSYSSSASTPYGTGGTTNGTMSVSDSSYTNTNGITAFSPQGHQPSTSFSQKGSIPNPRQSQGYYTAPGMYEGYSNPTNDNQAGTLHEDMIQSVIPGAMDAMMFDQVSYDVKPSMEELNEQHRQHTYQAYNPDTRPQSQLHHAVPSSQVWPQQGHAPDGAAPYWGDPNIPTDNQVFYS